MTNKNNTLIIGLLILLGVGGLVAYRMYGNASNQEEPVSQNPVMQEDSMETSESDNNSAMMQDGNNVYAEIVTIQAPEGSAKYVLVSPSNASYTVKKVFVDKPVADVTGVTNGVQGAGWYDETGNKFYLKANVDLTKLESDSDKRDSDIMPLFAPPQATIVINGDNATAAISKTEPLN